MTAMIRRERHAATSRTVAMVTICGLTCAAAIAWGQAPRRAPAAAPRPRPPTGAWDPITAGTFLSDAFSTLDGQRPAFTPGGRAPQPAIPTAGSAAPTSAAAADGVTWSALISEGTLTDEVKDLRQVLAAACDKPTEFKGGGFEEARVALSSLALAFGIIAAYDQDVRWKKDAATARDLFARAGFNCKVGTEQSFAESKARLEDLVAMLDGNAPAGRPDRDDDFRWSQVAWRPALMNRLEEAQDAMRPAIASKADWNGKTDQFLHAVEMVAAIGEVIRHPDYEHHEDDTYLGYAAAMRDAAVEARAACEKKDYDAARAAVGRIEKSCAACHGDFRS